MKSTLAIFLAVLLLSAFVYPFWGVTRGTALYGNLIQFLALVVAAINLWRVKKSFAATDAPRKAWGSLQLGVMIWGIAQLIELRDEVFLQGAHYGGFADAVWLIGYLPILYSLFLLISDFRSTGLPLGSGSSYVAQSAVLLILYALLFQLTIREHLADPGRAITMKILDLGYPTFDFLLFAGGSILLRFSWILRGGLLGRVWLLLCLGFLMSGVADILFSNLPDLHTAAYRSLDLLYATSYFLIALAAREQSKDFALTTP